MNYSDFAREKERMKEAAREEIRAIKRDGAEQRALLHALKKEAVARIQSDAEQERRRNDKIADKKANLIRLLGQAAQKGDFAEMNHIQRMIDELGQYD